MTSWASLAGFHGTTSKLGIITYSASSFVPKSAINALLIPPRWNEYLNSAQNAFTTRVQGAYDRSKAIKNVAGAKKAHPVKLCFFSNVIFLGLLDTKTPPLYP